MFLYFSGRYQDVGRVNSLARMIIQEIKQLSPVSKAKNAPAGHNFSEKAKECILSNLSAMLKQGGESMISILRIWRRHMKAILIRARVR
jgi:hypothetical protein